MYNLYELKQLFHLENSTDTITKCISHENSDRLIVILVVNKSSLLCYCLQKAVDEESNDSNRNGCRASDCVIIKKIPVDITSSIRDLCFSDSGSVAYLVLANGIILTIPIVNILLKEEDCIGNDATVIASSSLNSPTCIAFWQTLDGNKDVLIVGNEFGEMSFINARLKKEFGGTYVQNGVDRIAVVKDKFSIGLLINCKNGSQYRLTLEETRRKAGLRNSGSDFYDHYEEEVKYHYFGCFMTANDEFSTESCWNMKPKPIIFKSSPDETQSFTLIYQFPFFMNLSTSQSSQSRGIKIYSCNEFNYESSSSIASYFLPSSIAEQRKVILTERLIVCIEPTRCSVLSRDFSDGRRKQKLNALIQDINLSDTIVDVFRVCKMSDDNLLDSFVIVTSQNVYELCPKMKFDNYFVSMVTSSFTETNVLQAEKLASILQAEKLASMLGLNTNILYEKSANYCLENRRFHQAVRFYQMAKTPQSKRISNFVSNGFYSEVIVYIQVLFTSKGYEITEPDKLSFANIAINCYVQEIAEKKLKKEEKSVVRGLISFLKENQYYDDNIVISLLLEHELYELAEFCAKLRGQYSVLLLCLLKNKLFRPNSPKSGLEKFDFKEITDEPLKFYSTFMSLTCKEMSYAVVLRPSLLGMYLRTLIRFLPNMDLNMLERTAYLFDPRRATIQLLLNRVLSQVSQSYLKDDEHEDIVDRKDVLNFYIFVLLMILRHRGITYSFDYNIFLTSSIKSQYDAREDRKLPKAAFQLAAGQHHGAIIKYGFLYSWGKSTFGRLGRTDPYDRKTANSRSNPSTALSDHATGVANFLSIKRAKYESRNPCPVNLFSRNMNIAVLAVSCGSHHTLVLTDYGVYSFGSSRYGQLGLGCELMQTVHPTLIEDLIHEDIVKVECGQYHSLAVSSNGTLYTWGWGVHGQLGHCNIENVYSPMEVFDLRDKKIISAAGGYCHSVALDSEGSVYTFGSSMFGQLGQGNGCKCSTPKKLSFVEPIKEISTHYFHSLALSCNSNRMYTWGLNPQTVRLQAQSARKSRQEQNSMPDNVSYPCLDHLKPLLVDTSYITGEIIKIVTGTSHSMALTSAGHVYSWGRGPDGQLGQGSRKEVKEPTLITALSDQRIIDIAAGCYYSIAVDAGSQLWGWGQNSDGQIGFPVDDMSSGQAGTSGDSRKITIRTNRRVLTFTPGERQVEMMPVKIHVPENDDSSYDSLNYSFDIKAMKSNRQFFERGQHETLSNENVLTIDEQQLISVINLYSNDIDLNSVHQRCLKFQNYQGAALISEIKFDYADSLSYHLQGLRSSLTSLKSDEFIGLIKRLLPVIITKSLSNENETRKLIDVVIEFWRDNELTFNVLEMVLMECFEKHVHNFLFGVLFFQQLNEKNCIHHFSTPFLLNMTALTVNLISKSDVAQLITSKPIMDLLACDCKDATFPAEKLWQDILKNIQTAVDDISSDAGIVFTPDEDEMIIFSCCHFFGSNKFRTTILPKFEQDVTELVATSHQLEVDNLLTMYNDIFDNKSVENVCPQCLIKEMQSK